MSLENMATVTETIAGDEWSCNPFTVTTGGNYLKRLTKLFGESFAALTSSQSQEEAVQLAVVKLIDNMDKDDITGLIKAMLYEVQKNGQKINFDTEFARRYKVLFEVVKFVVKVNYGDFFTADATGE